MRNLQEIEKDLERVKVEIDNAWKKAHEEEKNNGKGDYKLFHELCRKKNELDNEYATVNRYNVKVGDGVTINYYTDSHAGTVIARTKTTLTIQRDKAIRIDDNGMSDCQEYKYERDEKGAIYKAHWSNAKGKFIVDGCLRVSNGRHEYYDYCF